MNNKANNTVPLAKRMFLTLAEGSQNYEKVTDTDNKQLCTAKNQEEITDFKTAKVILIIQGMYYLLIKG